MMDFGLGINIGRRTGMFGGEAPGALGDTNPFMALLSWDAASEELTHRAQSVCGSPPGFLV